MARVNWSFRHCLYIVVYRIVVCHTKENFIEIAKVLHGAQRWP